MAIVLTCDVPVDRWKNLLVQRGHVEATRPLDCPCYAAIRAECRDGFGEAHKIAKPCVRSKAHEHMDVIG
ncbi:MAG TPA: hypothetical protein VGQ06_00625 [Gemmatimonadales bacterium]|nr:hypothetical protein [Gemmatimonadales bacterium]